MATMLQVGICVALYIAATVDGSMPHSLYSPQAVCPPSLEQPFFPPLLTEVLYAAATCRCPIAGGAVSASAANLRAALQ